MRTRKTENYNIYNHERVSPTTIIYLLYARYLLTVVFNSFILSYHFNVLRYTVQTRKSARNVNDVHRDEKYNYKIPFFFFL